jgi:hypothetical protein
MRRANVVSGVLLAVFGLVMLFVVIPWQIEPGPQGMVSPSLVPNLMMIVITALAVLLAAINWRRGAGGAQTDSPPPISRAELAALLKIGAVFALAVALYLWVSPLAAGAVLIVGALVALGERRLPVIVLMPAALLLALWLLFYKVLGTAIV